MDISAGRRVRRRAPLRYARHPPKTEGRKPSRIERAKRLPVQIFT
jgi:hypothetical protein